MTPAELATAARRGRRRSHRRPTTPTARCWRSCAISRSRTSGSRASIITGPFARDSRKSILGLGKTPEQIAAIADRIVERGHPLLVTRVDDAAWHAVQRADRRTPSTTRPPARSPCSARCRGQGHDRHRLGGHVRHAGRRRSRGHRGADGQRRRARLRRRRRRHPSRAQRARAPLRRARHRRRRRHGRRAAERGRRDGGCAGDRACRPASATAPASAASRRCSACSTPAPTACRW